MNVFHVLLETRSVTAASTRFGITQPAMSNALARLRELFDDPLFVHSSEGMQPTPFALEIAGAVGGALHEFQRALEHRKAFEPATSDQTFRFHMTDMGQINFLPLLVERLRTIAPNVKVEAETLGLEDIRAALADGRINFALGHLPKLRGRGIRQAELLHERYAVLTRAGHANTAKPLTEKTYFDAAHAVVTSVGGGHSIVEEILVKKHARIMARLPNVMAVPMILSRSDLIATIPKRVATELAKTAALHLHPLPVNIPDFEVCVFWHDRFDANPPTIWMRELLIELFARA